MTTLTIRITGEVGSGKSFLAHKIADFIEDDKPEATIVLIDGPDALVDAMASLEADYLIITQYPACKEPVCN